MCCFSDLRAGEVGRSNDEVEDADAALLHVHLERPQG
jgi:hypothetical protein